MLSSSLFCTKRLPITAICRGFARIRYEYKAPKKEVSTKPLQGTELINRLDSMTHIQGGTAKKDKDKLNKSLHTSTTNRVNPIMIGTNETIATNMLEHLTEALESRKMKTLFKGVRDLDSIITFEHCHVNLDLSHCYVYWSSDVSDGFANFVADKKSETEAIQMLDMINDTVNKRLQAAEGYFRHHLIKKMDFRRVPRVYFEPYAKYLEKQEKKSTDNSEKMQFLRKEGYNSTI